MDPRRKSAGRPSDDETPRVLRAYSPRLAAWFARYVRRYFARHFNAVRSSSSTAPLADAGDPLIVVANHPAWWDPLHFMLLAAAELPGRRMYGPFDAQALEKYRFFERIGAFGIEHSTRGAARFLRTGLAVAREPGSTLWVTAEGEFADPRRRPLRLMPGVGHLASRLDGGSIVPLAIEYPFWNERLPEALSRFGEPFEIAAHRGLDAAGWTTMIEARLEQTMDELSALAVARDPEAFRTLQLGRAGVGGVYDVWRRGVAALTGRSFDPAHMDGERR